MARPLLMIPGPTEFDNAVLNAMSLHGTSHVDPSFIETFGNTIKQVRELFLASDGQPFILAGSGTVGWDLFAANLIAAGELALVVNTGYFSDSFGDCLQIYGAKVEHIRAPPGHIPGVEQVIAAVESNKNRVKLVTITHVDTSTAVRVPLLSYIQAIRKIVPDVIIAVDGVCAVGGEELRMTEWDIDAYLTGSQKAIGVPPGLSISVIRPRALRRADELSRNGQAPRSYYANVSKWLPIMRAYEDKKPSYFATPAVSLINALHVALTQVLYNGGVEQRVKEHALAANEFRSAIRQLGLTFVPIKEEYSANTLSAIRYPRFPEGVTNAQFLGECKKQGIIIAGGIHKDIKDEYFRVGHMGIATRDKTFILVTITAIQKALVACSHNARL